AEGAVTFAAPLVEASPGHLLGTSSQLGAGRQGSVFACDLSGTLTVLHSYFASTVGTSPFGGVVEGSPGVFFGTAQYGGSQSQGTIFRVDSPGNAVPLHAFDGTDGSNPMASPVFGADGRLYGTAFYGLGVGGSVFATDTLGSF